MTSRDRLKLYKNKTKISRLLMTEDHLRKNRFKLKKNLLETRKIMIMNTKINLTQLEEPIRLCSQK